MDTSTATARVFLSYRRDDCGPYAGRLADNLRDRARLEVFLDIDTIPPGENFPKWIEREIARCDAVIVMIGDDWLTLNGADGRPRLQDPLDWIHLEISSALKRDVPVIPVLVEGAVMPRPDELPEELRNLAFRHAVVLRLESWTQDFDRLAAALPSGREKARPARESGRPEVPAVTRRQPASLDFIIAHAFVESIPPGRWSAYKDVACAAGAPGGAMAVGNWLAARSDSIPHVWRVLNDKGEAALRDDWVPPTADLPATTAQVRERLQTEGVHFDVRGRASAAQRWTVDDAAEAGVTIAARPRSKGRDTSGDTVIVAGRLAYPDYLSSASYICQPGRSFRPIQYLGFYSERHIKREVPRILHRRDNVLFTLASADEIAAQGAPYDDEVASLVRKSLTAPASWRIQRKAGECYQVFILSKPGGEETVLLPRPVFHPGASAWTQHQRYVAIDQLRAAPATTDALATQ